MGRATILSGGPDGRYTIQIDSGEARRTQLLAAANANVLQVQAAVNTLILEVAEKQASVDAEFVSILALENAYITAIQTYGPTDPRTGEAYIAHGNALASVGGKVALLADAKTRLSEARLLLSSAQKRANRWNSLNLIQTRQAWCADLTETAAGTVATLEIPGESDLVLVAPGAPAATSGDGYLFSRELMSPEQAYFNAAILPGWQKYKPTFRRGVITALDEDNHRANVSLPNARSSAQRLGVNQSSSLTNVPVTYMTCNSAAFAVGDDVVVQFDGQAWSSPRVIGFVSDPRTCVSYNLASGSVSDLRLLPASRFILMSFTFRPSSPAHFASIVSSAASGAMSVFYRRAGRPAVQMFNYNPLPSSLGSAVFLDQGSELIDQGESFFLQLATPTPSNAVLEQSATVFINGRYGVEFPDRDIIFPGEDVEFIAVVSGKVVFTCAVRFSLNDPSLCNMSGSILDSAAFVRIYDTTPIGGPPAGQIESPGSVAKFDYPLRRIGSSYP